MNVHDLPRFGRFAAIGLAVWLAACPGPAGRAETSAAENSRPELKLGRTAEYDYDPPTPGCNPLATGSC
jgi:hypothetical protein